MAKRLIIVGGLNRADPWKNIDSEIETLGLSVSRFNIATDCPLRENRGIDDVVQCLKSAASDQLALTQQMLFLTFSIGGIVVQKLLTGLGADLAAKVPLVIFVAKPETSLNHYWQFSCKENSGYISELKNSSHTFIDLQSAWARCTRKHKIRVISVVGIDDKFARYEPIAHWDSSNLVVLPDNHTSIAQNDRAVIKVLREYCLRS